MCQRLKPTVTIVTSAERESHALPTPKALVLHQGMHHDQTMLSKRGQANWTCMLVCASLHAKPADDAARLAEQQSKGQPHRWQQQQLAPRTQRADNRGQPRKRA
jgi:hypothetical protein